MNTNTRVFKMSFASVYPHYVQKVEKKGRTVDELHEVICWLTGYDVANILQIIEQKIDFETSLQRENLAYLKEKGEGQQERIQANEQIIKQQETKIDRSRDFGIGRF